MAFSIAFYPILSGTFLAKP
uniref:Uncharacterized protein n=1 Tax=Moniliophthora roreri TaxID=221103 RepID=A0A0W0FJE5_MONRR